MKNRKPTDKQIKNVYLEHHSNLALLSTAVAMVSLMIFMLLYMGTLGNVTPERAVMAYSVAPVIGVACWIIAAVLCLVIAVKKKIYLIEFAVYSLIMGFGLFFIYNMPAFFYNNFKNTYIVANWAKSLFVGMLTVSAVYLVVSVVWHLILATPKKKK